MLTYIPCETDSPLEMTLINLMRFYGSSSNMFLIFIQGSFALQATIAKKFTIKISPKFFSLQLLYKQKQFKGPPAKEIKNLWCIFICMGTCYLLFMLYTFLKHFSKETWLLNADKYLRHFNRFFYPALRHPLLLLFLLYRM